jgi:hypothetical protein
MIPLVCPHCLTVVIVDQPPPLGAPPLKCPCLDRPPFCSAVALMRLRLPEGYELVLKA